MKITIIHGQSHKGSTYHIARMIAEKSGGEITEFFLPRDFGSFCTGCATCFIKSENLCPHYEKLKPVTEAINNADVIILASPVYVYHATGAMKNLLDHYGYRWMVHRPEEKMFNKQAVCISTAAGAGMKSTNKDMADSTFFWGIPKTYKYGTGVAEISWERVSDKIKKRIDKKTDNLARKIRKNYGNVKPSVKTKAFFYIMHLMQKNGWNEADVNYWKEKGWTEKKRPWKN
ncbi:MAG: flavodoxin family protein [Acutalibacteraceae bacterium]